MNEVHKTLFIPLYGKSQVSRKGIILKDPMAEKIWEAESFPIHGKSKSKWLAYNMAMRARVFDDWTGAMLRADKDALVLHIGCGLDSRCLRVKEPYRNWIDADFPEVLSLREKYYQVNDAYRMMAMDATEAEQIERLPDSEAAIVILEGVSMYLTNQQVSRLFQALEKKYSCLHILMDVYTEFGAKASKYKNPVNDVGVTKLYGIDDMERFLKGTKIKFKGELSFTPDALVNELKSFERVFFKLMFTGTLYRKIYRLYGLELLS
ncbi:MAG: class I SAM-dependent methyltransferase [Oscillospiraceae bacterium]|nr:class I SAM-dependent methyltransferase [Oscillospiraceae bacterium]